MLVVNFLLLLEIDLSAKGKIPEFVFNKESDYWPTNGWKFSEPEKQGVDSKVLYKMLDEIEDNNISIYSVLVVKNGYVVLEANKNEPEDTYTIYSTTKSISSAIFGIALAQGHFESVDQRVYGTYPGFISDSKDSRKSAITFKHLLTMSSGYDWPEIETSLAYHGNPEYQMEVSGNWIKFVLNRPLVDDPGKLFNYNSGNAHLLLASLTWRGLDIIDFADKNLFSPLGILKKHYFWSTDSSNIPNGSHGLAMRPRDMAKIGYLYLKGGNWEGREIIPETWIKESTKNHIKMNWNGYIADYYGYTWYLQPFGFHSLGYQGQYIFVLPGAETVAVFSSELDLDELPKPIELVKKYILPKAKGGSPLPRNKEAYSRLKKRVVQFYENRFW